MNTEFTSGYENRNDRCRATSVGGTPHSQYCVAGSEKVKKTKVDVKGKIEDSSTCIILCQWLKKRWIECPPSLEIVFEVVYRPGSLLFPVNHPFETLRKLLCGIVAVVLQEIIERYDLGNDRNVFAGENR